MAHLITHAAVRLYPCKELSGRWRAVNLYTCVSYGCSKLAAMLLVAFMDGGSPSELSADLSKKYGFQIGEIDSAITKLGQLGLLVPPDEHSHQEVRTICLEWSKYGWVDAADYHVATLNYPFADYAAHGREIDFQRMRQYASEQPDTNRTKQYREVHGRIVAPSTPDVLKGLVTPFSEIWANDPDLETLDATRCLHLLSAVFGKLRSRTLSDSPHIIADAIGKTSPSGGSRHPTECYLFATAVHGLEKGIYHFNVENSTLDLLADFDDSKEELLRLFSGPLRASFCIHAFVVMTSVFERSMWRYREPRSFRAIYMDVGHLCGTLDLTVGSPGTELEFAL